MKSSNIGGQAVLEGIMMRHGDDYAVAVRKPDGKIFVKDGTRIVRVLTVWAGPCACFANIKRDRISGYIRFNGDIVINLQNMSS